MKKKAERKHKRKDTVVLLNVAPEYRPAEEVRAAIVNISMGGCAFEARKKFKKGLRVIIRFTFPSKKVYVITGQIKRVRSKAGGSYIHGVQFDKAGFFEKLRRKIFIKKIS